MTEHEVPVAGGTLHAWDEGGGPPVLILHGGPGLSEYTEGLAGELLSGWRTIRYQQRGMAPSTAGGPFDVDVQVADAVAVLDALGLAAAHVVGHSWGGHLAMHLAVAHPERVAGLVVVDPLGAVPDGGLSDLGTNLMSRISPEAAARVAALEAGQESGTATEEDSQEFLRLVWPAYFATPSHAPPMPPISFSVPVNAATMASVVEHFEQRTLEEGLPALRMPAVFVLGAGSPIPAKHGEASAALVAGARVVVLEGCGHFPWVEGERPGCVREALDGLAGAAN